MKEVIFIAMALLTVVALCTGIPVMARDLDTLGYPHIARLGRQHNIVVSLTVAGITVMSGTMAMTAVNVVLFAGIITTTAWVALQKRR